MQGYVRVITLLLFFLSLGCHDVSAWPWDPETVAVINGKRFTVEGVRHWWQHWKEKDAPFPKTAEPFLEWHLLAQQAASMELFNEPAYKRKVETFLKVRVLMFLKRDEVDSKIKIKEKDLRKRYQKQYSPIWHVKILYFDEQEKANRAYDDLTAGKSSFAAIAARPSAEGGPVRKEEKPLRPVSLKDMDGWLKRLTGLKEGEAAAPLPMGDLFAVLLLDTRQIPEAADYEKLKGSIRKQIWDRGQTELTSKLVESLKKKYNVKVDEELLAMADSENLPREFLDKPLVTSNRGNFPLGALVRQIHKDRLLRTRQTLSPEQKKWLKQGLLDGMVSQAVTIWGGLDRQYEEKPPFKWTYQFYTQHRLIKELEKRLLKNGAEVSDQDASDYYQAHRDLFTQPAMVKIAEIEGGKAAADKTWLDIVRGEAFSAAVKKQYPHEPKTSEVPLNHMTQRARTAVAKLVPGEVSEPFGENDTWKMIKLVSRKSAKVTPFDKAKPTIVERIRKEKAAETRAGYVAELKARSEITVNHDVWETIKDEFDG